MYIIVHPEYEFLAIITVFFARITVIRRIFLLTSLVTFKVSY
jgi:hypothetical protein